MMDWKKVFNQNNYHNLVRENPTKTLRVYPDIQQGKLVLHYIIIFIPIIDEGAC